MNVRIGSRHEFIATVLCFNSRHICLEHIHFDTMEAALFRDHSWLVYCRKWRRLELKTGETVRFSAKINQYKHFGKHQMELTNIRNIERIEDA